MYPALCHIHLSCEGESLGPPQAEANKIAMPSDATLICLGEICEMN